MALRLDCSIQALSRALSAIGAFGSECNTAVLPKNRFRAAARGRIETSGVESADLGGWTCASWSDCAEVQAEEPSDARATCRDLRLQSAVHKRFGERPQKSDDRHDLRVCTWNSCGPTNWPKSSAETGSFSIRMTTHPDRACEGVEFRRCAVSYRSRQTTTSQHCCWLTCATG